MQWSTGYNLTTQSIKGKITNCHRVILALKYNQPVDVDVLPPILRRRSCATIGLDQKKR